MSEEKEKKKKKRRKKGNRLGDASSLRERGGTTNPAARGV